MQKKYLNFCTVSIFKFYLITTENLVSGHVHTYWFLAGSKEIKLFN